MRRAPSDEALPDPLADAADTVPIFRGLTADQCDGVARLNTDSVRLCVNFRHAGWDPQRRRVYRALRDIGTRPATLHAFATCGADSWVYATKTAPVEYRIAGNH